jgi:opacity protein-like surface antigen
MKKVLLMAVAFSAVVLVSASAFAASPLRAVGVEAGYVSPDVPSGAPDMNTWVAGVFLDFGLPATNLYVNPFVNYWNWSDGQGTAETSFRDWTIGANLKWSIPTAGAVSPFLAAGASAHMLNVSQESINLDEGDTKLGFQLGGGAKIGVSQSASIIGSGWYHIVEDVNQWSLRAGLAWSI